MDGLCVTLLGKFLGDSEVSVYLTKQHLGKLGDYNFAHSPWTLVVVLGETQVEYEGLGTCATSDMTLERSNRSAAMLISTYGKCQN